MNDRAKWALARGHRREDAAAAQALKQVVDVDVPAQDLDYIFEEREDIPARVPRAKRRALAAVLQAEIDPGMWLNIVNVKDLRNLADLELESM